MKAVWVAPDFGKLETRIRDELRKVREAIDVCQGRVDAEQREWESRGFLLRILTENPSKRRAWDWSEDQWGLSEAKRTHRSMRDLLSKVTTARATFANTLTLNDDEVSLIS